MLQLSKARGMSQRRAVGMQAALGVYIDRAIGIDQAKQARVPHVYLVLLQQYPAL